MKDSRASSQKLHEMRMTQQSAKTLPTGITNHVCIFLFRRQSKYHEMKSMSKNGSIIAANTA